jgi:endoglucanase
MKFLQIVMCVCALFIFSEISSVKAQTNSNPFSENNFYVDFESPAYQSYKSNGSELLKKIGTAPQAKWFTGWESDIYNSVKNYVDKASSLNQIPVLVSYNIPLRDCGGYSGGGALNFDSYKKWVNSFASATGDNKVVIILEPDGLGLMDCLTTTLKNIRLDLYNYAVDAFSKNVNATIYIDASMWVTPTKMAEYLQKAGVSKTRGISINVSNFKSNSAATDYVQKVKTALGQDIHGVIDTSRNGVDPINDEWCNPWGKGLGYSATSNTGNSLIDAFYWIKRPGESDGRCNGGPNAGNWWESYAIELAKNAANLPVVINPQPEPEPVPTQPKNYIKIFAGGTQVNNVFPTFDLYINSSKVKSFSNVNADGVTRKTKEYLYEQQTEINAQKIKIVFTNDAANSNQDRNLFIDKIDLNGTEYQTENQQVLSQGSWSADNACNLGYKKSEWLHCSGFFEFNITKENLEVVEPPVVQNNNFSVKYFNNTNLQGSVVASKTYEKINFNWGDNSPTQGVNRDNFSIIAESNTYFDNGLYRFSIAADDGVRVYIDNVLVLDKWQNQSATYEFNKQLSSGVHKIKIEYYELNGGARLQFDFNKIN